MPRYLLRHLHEPRECGVVFASFKGRASPLRHRATLASCRSGGRAIWWTVDADTEEEALALLPRYVGEGAHDRQPRQRGRDPMIAVQSAARTAGRVTCDAANARELPTVRRAASVALEDALARDRFEITVERDRALDAFYNPSAYAASEEDQ